MIMYESSKKSSVTSTETKNNRQYVSVSKKSTESLNKKGLQKLEKLNRTKVHQ